MESALHTLEFDRILERLASFASSVLGEELALQVRPSYDLKIVDLSLKQTTELRDILDYDQAIPIDGIVDIRPSLKKARIMGSYLQPDELAQVSQTFAVVRRLERFFTTRQEKIPRLKKITSELVPLEKIEKEINRCVDASIGSVKDSASPALAAIRKQIERAQASARRKIEALLRDFSSHGMLQENVVTLRNGRLVLVIKEEFRRKVRGLIHDQSASGASLFVEPLETLEDNNRIRELQADEAKEIERILRALTDLLRESLDVINSNVHLLAELDLIYAKAALSKALNANQPELVEENQLHIAKGRHPLLVLRMGEKNVVPLDVELGHKFRTLIISGPNAGGKTVALKTVGLLALMAQSGLHIPALPHSKVGGIKQVFASIGDQQSIENDLSTFSSHLTSLRGIAVNADSRSLVLIDEIGAGTDPEEGNSLAMALLERLTQLGSLSVVTTHQSALKAFAYRTEGVENGSMEFDVQTLRPTYRFRVGIPGSSYAFEIAQRMGLPASLIEAARNLVGAQKEKLEGLILELEGKIQNYAELIRQADLREREHRGFAQLYQERSDALKREEKQLKRKAVEEAEEILRQANVTVERTIREIKESQAQREVIQAAKRDLAAQYEEVKRVKVEELAEAVPAEEEETDVSATIALGDYAKWDKIGSSGTVISEPDKQGRVMLQTGTAKVRVPLTELRKISRKEKPPTGFVNIRVERPEVYKSEVDLRGMRAEEAKEVVDRFLDEAMMAGFKEIRVIHGKGTGSLRKNIGAFLREHPRVLNTRLGNWNEGDSGVTVVELRDS